MVVRDEASEREFRSMYLALHEECVYKGQIVGEPKVPAARSEKKKIIGSKSTE